MTRPQNTTVPAVRLPEAQPIDPDLSQRDRRYMRAITGWLASGMRARARERQRERDERPARDPRHSGTGG
jgi:hypothetical protein